MQRLGNDIEYWLYRAYKELGLIDEETAIKLMDYLHEEIRRKYEVYEAPEDEFKRKERMRRIVREGLEWKNRMEKRKGRKN